MMANITFLSFLLFLMRQSRHGAVNTWLNCSFLHYEITTGVDSNKCRRRPLACHIL